MTFIKNTSMSKIVHNASLNPQTALIAAGGLSVYPGTEVTYTPASNSTNVVYECNYQIGSAPDNEGSYLCTRLQYSDDNGVTWNDILGTRLFEGVYNQNGVADYSTLGFYYSFLLDTWTGERKLRLAGQSHIYWAEYTVNANPIITSGYGAGTSPHVTVYSIVE